MVWGELLREKLPKPVCSEYTVRGGSRNLGRGGHRKGVGAGGGCAPSRAKRGSFEQYSDTDTHS